MKTKVILATTGTLAPTEFDADSVGQSCNYIYVFKKGKKVAVLDNSRRRIHAAFVVKEKKRKWKLKLTKE